MSNAATVRDIADAAATAAERADGVQLELLAPATRYDRAAPPAAASETRIGRPLGARNIATRRTVEFVRRCFGDPMIESARWLLLTPSAMAAELNCTLLEAFEQQEAIRRDLRRYMHPMLASVDGDGAAVVPFLQVLVGGGGAAPGQPPWLSAPGMAPIVESEQNQRLSVSDAAKPHDAAPHDDANALNSLDNP